MPPSCIPSSHPAYLYTFSTKQITYLGIRLYAGPVYIIARFLNHLHHPYIYVVPLHAYYTHPRLNPSEIGDNINSTSSRLLIAV